MPKIVKIKMKSGLEDIIHTGVEKIVEGGDRFFLYDTGSQAIAVIEKDQIANLHTAEESELTVVQKFPWDGELFAPGPKGAVITLPDGPVLFLTLSPEGSSGLRLDHVDVQAVSWNNLLPFGLPPEEFSPATKEWHRAWGQNGAVLFTSSGDDPSIVRSASMLTRHGSLHGISFHFPGASEAWPSVRMPDMEEILINELHLFLTVAEANLHLEPPLRVEVGIENVKTFTLQHRYEHDKAKWDDIGQIITDRIEVEVEVRSFGVIPGEIFLPFFRRVYDEAGCTRPESS